MGWEDHLLGSIIQNVCKHSKFKAAKPNALTRCINVLLLLLLLLLLLVLVLLLLLLSIVFIFRSMELTFISSLLRLKIRVYKTIIFPVVLYSCEAWSLTLREERRLWVFEKRILRRMSGPKGDANSERRRLHNEELHSLYRSPNIVRVIKSRRLRWAEHVARMQESRSAFNILTG